MTKRHSTSDNRITPPHYRNKHYLSLENLANLKFLQDLFYLKKLRNFIFNKIISLKIFFISNLKKKVVNLELTFNLFPLLNVEKSLLFSPKIL